MQMCWSKSKNCQHERRFHLGIIGPDYFGHCVVFHLLDRSRTDAMMNLWGGRNPHWSGSLKSCGGNSEARHWWRNTNFIQCENGGSISHIWNRKRQSNWRAAWGENPDTPAPAGTSRTAKNTTPQRPSAGACSAYRATGSPSTN